MKQIILTAIIFALCGVTSCGNKNGRTYYDGDEFTAKTEEGVEMEFKVLDADNKTCQVGIGVDHNAIDTKYIGKVTIPQEINGFRIISIADYAFEFCDMSKIIIPEGVTIIKEGAFFSCDNLRDISLPVSLTTIERWAFVGCDQLRSLYIPKNVAYISKSIYSCENIVDVSVDKDNKVYDSRNNCNAIIETSTNTLIEGCITTEIPDGVITIGEDAFEECRLTTVKIPSSVKVIEKGAFGGCDLIDIHIPQNVEIISESAFKNSDNTIEKITVDEKNRKYDSRNNCNAIIETSTNKLIKGCKNTIIPSNTRIIGEEAFANCEIKTIKIPSSVKNIDSEAFANCKKMYTIDLPEGLERIMGHGAFMGCSSLKSITIPSTVRSIGIGIFKDCSALESIIVEPDNPYWDSRNNCNAIIFTKDNILIAGCKNTIIPNDVCIIEENAFAGSGLSHIVIPENVKKIGENALGDATIITSLIREPFPVHHDIDTLYVPKGTKEKYEKCKGWNKAKNIVELDY